MQAKPISKSKIGTERRTKKLSDDFGVAPAVPASDDLDVVRKAAQTCHACPLWRNATCAVFGEGPQRAKIIMVGEQPGDQEDLAGKPFVGPAGKLLDRALEAAGVDRTEIYVTNAVKHFKWTPHGKRRLHQKPNSREIAACRPWLAKEISLLKPRIIVCLGATATQTVVGPAVKVTQVRGQSLDSVFGVPALMTVHPSSLLRQPDRARAEEDFAAFVADLKKLNRFQI